MKQSLRHKPIPKRSLLGSLARFVGPFVTYNLFGQATPVLAGYKITHKCNLKCRHCPYWKLKTGEQSFEGVLATLRGLQRLGVRILILEGGEPLLWRDASHDIEDVVSASRDLFPCVCMTTNGTLNWSRLPLNRIWVSLDGTEEINDSLRGIGVFQTVLKNIASEHAPDKVYISTTVSNENIDSIPDLILFLKGLVGGVTIQFYYPYHGLPDPLYVNLDDRKTLLDRLIEMKMWGYPIVNTVQSLQQLKQSGWLCEDRLLANADPDGTISEGCYLKNRGPSLCTLCGFTAHNEMSLAFNGNVSSIRAGLVTFFH